MKLGEALKAAAAARSLPAAREGFLVCGFEPLHLPVFLQAFSRARLPAESLRVSHGLFGDLLGNVERARISSSDDGGAAASWSERAGRPLPPHNMCLIRSLHMLRRRGGSRKSENGKPEHNRRRFGPYRLLTPPGQLARDFRSGAA